MDQLLKRLQDTELEILTVVDSFCRNNKINYSLSYGTLIGAVRHEGFIPWDDDIDLMMYRTEYDRFIKRWLLSPPEGYFLQTDETDPSYGNNFLKIRKNGTTFIQDEAEKNCHYHTGVFIDIFPVDRVAPPGIQRKMQFLACQINMLMTRNHVSGKQGFTGIVERLLLSLPVSTKRQLKRISFLYKTRWNSSSQDNLLLFWNGTMFGAKKYFESDLFDSFTELPFEGNHFKAFSCYDSFLKSYFGDYMQLPPEEKRKTHHPLVISFDKEYKDLIKDGQ